MRKNRNYSLDILRVLSMFGIIGLHVLNQGGVIENVKQFSLNYYIIQFIVILCYCSVNIFAMLTGYLYCEREKTKSGSLIKLLTTSFFYCILLLLVMRVFKPDIFLDKTMYIKSIFPPIDDRYWYITCYVFVFFMIPFINKLINGLTKREFKVLIFLTLFFLSIVTTFGIKDYFRVESGYSPFWLICCYLIGAYIKIYGFPKEITNGKICLIVLITIFFVAISWNIISIVSELFWGEALGYTLLVRYNSPFMVSNAALILCMFSRCKITNGKRVIKSLANSAFSVYIIHSHILIFDYIIKDAFIWVGSCNFVICLVSILVAICSIYIFCWGIDIMRQWLFEILKIEYFITKLGMVIDKNLLYGDR